MCRASNWIVDDGEQTQYTFRSEQFSANCSQGKNIEEVFVDRRLLEDCEKEGQ
jgi:hypothetical protein